MRERGMTGGQQGGGRVPPIGQTNTLHFLLTTDKKKNNHLFVTAWCLTVQNSHYASEW